MEHGFLDQGKIAALNFTLTPNVSYADISKQILPVNNDVSDTRPFCVANTGPTTIKWLLDTGASLSVLEESIFNQLQVPIKKVKDPFSLVTGATGHSLELLGTYLIPIHIPKYGAVTYPITVVRTLPTKAILGNDFMKKYGVIINGATGKYVITGLQTAILTLTKDIFLPPLSATLTKLKPNTKASFQPPEHTQAFIENIPTTSNTMEVLEVITTVKKDGTVTTALLNNSNTELRLQKGTEVATLQPIRHAAPLTTVLNEISTQTPNAQPSQNKINLINSVANISGSQIFKQQVLQLLHKYHTCISDGPYDLGRTTFMQHNIHLTTERPIHIKQF